MTKCSVSYIKMFDVLDNLPTFSNIRIYIIYMIEFGYMNVSEHMEINIHTRLSKRNSFNFLPFLDAEVDIGGVPVELLTSRK